MGRRSAWGNEDESSLPQFYCSSDDFQRMIRQDHPQWLVPEHAVVYLRYWLPWSPESEQPHADGLPCPDHERIRPGSLLACPQCQLSGYERPLAEQRRLSGYPPAEAPKPKPAPPAPAPRPHPVERRPANPAAAKRHKQWANLAWSKPSPPRTKVKRRSA